MTTEIASTAPLIENNMDRASLLFPTEAGRRGFSPLELHYLERIYTLSQMKRDLAGWPSKDPLPRKLIARGLYAAYCACRDLGLDEEARRVLGSV